MSRAHHHKQVFLRNVSDLPQRKHINIRDVLTGDERNATLTSFLIFSGDLRVTGDSEKSARVFRVLTRAEGHGTFLRLLFFENSLPIEVSTHFESEVVWFV